MKKILSILLSVLLIVTAIQVSVFALGNPTATVSISNARISTRTDTNGNPVDVIAVDVNISENTGSLFAARFLVLSDDSLAPHEIKSGNYTFYDYDRGTFASDEASLGYTVMCNTNTITALGKTGFQVLVDSNNGSVGIDAERGSLGTYYFDIPQSCGEYSFSLVWLDDADDGGGVIDSIEQYVVNVSAGNISLSVHHYDNTCDTDCNVCGDIREITHTYFSAYLSNENEHWKQCSVCGDKDSIELHIYGNVNDAECDVCHAQREVPENTYNVKELTISNVSVIENTSGFVSDGTYIYYYIYPEFTLELNDGTVLTSESGWIEIQGEYLRPSLLGITSGQPWTVGNTYEVTGELFGLTDTFDVTIIESPIKDIIIDDIILTEGCDGNYSDGKYYYNVYLDEATVQFKDETFFKGDTIVINGLIYSLNDNSYMLQEEEPWTAGNTYEVTVELLGVTATFNVTIKKNSIDYIEVRDFIFIDGIDDQWSVNPAYKVYFKDGTSKECNGGEDFLLDEGYFYLYTDSYDKEYNVGETMPMKAYLGGREATFNVTVVENPITSIEVITPPQKTEYLLGEGFNLQGATIRFNYSDNTYEDVTIDYLSHYNINETYIYLSKLDRWGYFWCGMDSSVIGQTEATLYVFNTEVGIECSVIDREWESVSIKNGEDRSLIITVTKAGGTTEDFKVLGTYFDDGGYDEYEILIGKIITDKGIFTGKFNTYDDGRFFIDIYYPDSETTLTSNILDRCYWAEVDKILDDAPFLMFDFNGTVTAENIDDIIIAALYINEAYDGVYTKTQIEEMVNSTFALEGFDIKLSKNYNEETREYTYYGFGTGGPWLFERPYDINFENDTWTIKLNYQTLPDELGGSKDGSLTLKLAQDLKIVRIIKDYTVGDIDANGEVDTSDLALMKLHLAGARTLDETGELAGDIDANGEVDTSDLALLKLHLAGARPIV